MIRLMIVFSFLLNCGVQKDSKSYAICKINAIIVFLICSTRQCLYKVFNQGKFFEK